MHVFIQLITSKDALKLETLVDIVLVKTVGSILPKNYLSVVVAIWNQWKDILMILKTPAGLGRSSFSHVVGDDKKKQAKIENAHFACTVSSRIFAFIHPLI